MVRARHSSVEVAMFTVYSVQMTVSMIDVVRQPSNSAMNEGKKVLGLIDLSDNCTKIDIVTIPNDTQNVTSDAVAKGSVFVSLPSFDLLSASSCFRHSKTSAMTQIAA